MFDDDEEIEGEASFELLLRDGAPLVSGCYFMHPVIKVAEFAWDVTEPSRVLVTATDGSKWRADDVSREGDVNVVLQQIDA